MMTRSNGIKSVAVVVTIIGLSGAAHAASWSSQPSWASGPSDTTYVRKPMRDASRETNYDLSPFAPGSHNVALDVGQIFLMGNLSSDYSDSIGTQIHYTYGVSDMFGFDSSLGLSNHSDGQYSQMTLLTGLRTNLAWYDKVVPYVTAGLGFYKPSYQFRTSTSNTSVSPVLFGLHLGPGVDLAVTRNLFFGTSLTFHDMFGTTKVTKVGLRDVGGTYTSFFLRAGMTF